MGTRGWLHAAIISTSLLLVAVVGCGIPHAGSLGPAGSGTNSLRVENGTGEFALVRIRSASGVTAAELPIAAGSSASCSLANGQYFEVVRFGTDERSYRYARGQGFTLAAPFGQSISATLTLHGVVQGNYATSAATAADF